MLWLKALIGGLIAVAVAIAVVPLAVLADLKDGGTGWGLCPEGLAECRTGYFSGFELLLGVVVALVAVLLVIRLCVRTLRHYERRQKARAFIASQQAAWARQQRVWQQREAAWTAPGSTPAPPPGAAGPDRAGAGSSTMATSAEPIR